MKLIASPAIDGVAGGVKVKLLRLTAALRKLGAEAFDFGSRMMQVVTQIFPFITPAKFRGGHAQTPN